MRLCAAIVLCCLLCSTTALAQDWKQVRKADEAKWAKATRLDPGTIHKLWRQASRAANEKDDDSRIADMDVEGLSERNQVLLVTYTGEKNCLTLTVFRQYSATAFSKVWSVEQGPDGQGFCDSPFGSASADVVKSVIQVRVPQAPDTSNGYANYVVYDYEWNGITYHFTGSERNRAGNRRPRFRERRAKGWGPRHPKGWLSAQPAISHQLCS